VVAHIKPAFRSGDIERMLDAGIVVAALEGLYESRGIVKRPGSPTEIGIPPPVDQCWRQTQISGLPGT
jgi:hypothetical protein